VVPSIAPAGLSGNLVVNGSGSLNFVPGAGVSFQNCCSNTNNAFYRFSGVALGGLFNVSQGQVSFTLQSRYSFAQRSATAAAARYAFDARDANGHKFYFQTQVTSGALVFTYMAGGVAQYYYAPKGTEDQLFGSGVSLKVAIKWDGKTTTLLLNGSIVKSSAYVPVAANWSSASLFDLGAYEYQSTGGYNSLDDVIGNFAVSSSALLQLTGVSTELTSVFGATSTGFTTGATVTPASSPASMTGKLVVNGTGAVNFVAGSGVYFTNCCTNSNNAFYRFTGAGLNNVFNIPVGQISFTLKSRYSYAQRQASAATARYAFDARDANGHKFYFQTQVTSGALVFTYMVGGVAQYYYAPKGTEDQLFGNGVSLNVAVKWDGKTTTLLLNGAAVKSSAYAPLAASWTSASIFDFGGYEYLTYGGYNSLDDFIRDFSVLALDPPTTTTTTMTAAAPLLAVPAAAVNQLATPQRRNVASSLSCSPNTIAPGQTAVCELQIGRANPSDSETVVLSSSSAQVAAPALLALRAGQTAVRFEVTAAAAGEVALEARSSNDLVTGRLRVEPVADAAPAIAAPATVDPAAPQIVVLGDVGSDQALAVHFGSSMLAALPSDRFDGQPARPGDVLSLALAGIDCAAPSGASSLRVRIGDAFAAVLALQPDDATPGVCRAVVETPSAAPASRAAVTIYVVGPDGAVRSSNTASIAIE